MKMKKKKRIPSRSSSGQRLILFHGTTTKFLEEILQKGLLPRTGTGNSNYSGDIESRPEFVYLTSHYPMFYSVKAVEKNGGDCVIIAVDVPAAALYPDEDFIGTALSKSGKTGKSLSSVIKEVNVLEWQHLWAKSLELMGTVCCLGVDPGSILGHAIVPKNIQLQLALGLDSNPQALASFGIPILALEPFRNLQGRLETLFAEGAEAVLEQAKREAKEIMKSLGGTK